MGRPQHVSTDPKQILHGTVHRQEALRVADGRESSHLVLALPRRLMRDFRLRQAPRSGHIALSASSATAVWASSMSLETPGSSARWRSRE